jgi:hypothetical protein
MTTGADLKDLVLLLAGNFFAMILTVRAVGHFARRDWGEFTAMIIAAIVVVGFVYFPDQSIGALKSVWTTFLGKESA